MLGGNFLMMGGKKFSLGRLIIALGIVAATCTAVLSISQTVSAAPSSTWYESFDNNANGWTFVNGASISGGVLDATPTYSRGLNSLNFLDNLTIDSITIDYDAYRSSSSGAISSVEFSYLDYKVVARWNYYPLHGVYGFSYRDENWVMVKKSYPQESGWRHIRIVLEDLTTGSPRASYYFQNEGIMKTVAENEPICYYPGEPDLPESTAIRMGNGFHSTVQFDNLTISYSEPEPPPAPPVGGTVRPVNKLALLAPYIILAALIAIASASVAVYWRRR